MTVAPLVSLLTAALVMAAFRLPAFMMFRGIRPGLLGGMGLRRPIMVVRAPMARSIAVANSRVGIQPNSSTMEPPPLHYPRPQLWPFPGPLVPPIQYMPPNVKQKSPDEQMAPSYSPPHPPLPPPQPSQTFIKPVFVPTPPPNKNKELKSSKSVNNRPFYHPMHKYDYGLSTTPQPTHYEDHFHQVFRPTNNRNKYRKIQKTNSLKRITTESYNSLTVNKNIFNEEYKYSMMYPMPRNYQNHRIESQLPIQTSTVKPQISLETIPSNMFTTTTPTAKSITKIWVKPSLKLIDSKNDSLHNSPLYLKQTNSIQTSSVKSTPIRTKNRFRPKSGGKTTITTTTTELTTEMTPAPIENYKPVKARKDAKINQVHPNHREKPSISERLMFDETKNIYYFVTLSSI